MTISARSKSRASRRVISILAAMGLGAGMVAALSPAAAAAAATCVVIDRTTAVAYRGTGSNLQKAIDAAAAGTILTIKGSCIGTFTIGENLKLSGHPTPVYPTATLDGNASGTVLTIAGYKTKVTLLNLAVTGGSEGGIRNQARLFLRNTKVDSNANIGEGGGIYNSAGTVIMNGSSSVSGNTASHRGGGIDMLGGILIMNDTSSVSGNTVTSSFRSYGGGVSTFTGSSVTMNDSSSVSGNHADFGSGINNYGWGLTLNDSASVSGNTALSRPADWKQQGGGIYNYGPLSMNGSSTVTGNTAREGGGIYNKHTGDGFSMNDFSSVIGNTASSAGGGIYNHGTLLLAGSASVTGNEGSPGGGIYSDTRVLACTTWTGALSPNTPDDPPTPMPAAC